MTFAEFLLALALFQIKHFAADFLLQPAYVWRNKGRYGHPGGILHGGAHGLLSLPALIVLGLPLPLVLLFAVGEAVLHYHLDWAKESLNSRLALRRDQAAYWYLFGLDQALHQLTYVAMLGLAHTLLT